MIRLKTGAMVVQSTLQWEFPLFVILEAGTEADHCTRRMHQRVCTANESKRAKGLRLYQLSVNTEEDGRDFSNLATATALVVF